MAKAKVTELNEQVAQKFLDSLMEAIEAKKQGKPVRFDWVRPWKSAGGTFAWPVRADTAHGGREPLPYTGGVNAAILVMEAAERGYSNSGWMTTVAARKWHAHARKGETGTPIFVPIPKYKRLPDGGYDTDDRGNRIRDGIFFGVRNIHNLDQMEPNKLRVGCDHCGGKGYTAYDIKTRDALEDYECEQCNGLGWWEPGGIDPKAQRFLDLKERLKAKDPEPIGEGENHWLGDALIDHYLGRKNAPAFTRRAQNRAYYRPRTHSIHVPLKGQYRNVSERLGVELHECAHSTGHASMLGRRGITNFDAFGSHQYSEEELVAEVASAILRARLGVDDDRTDRNTEAYLGGWADKLSTEPQVIIRAFRAAQKAVEKISQNFNFNQEQPIDAAEHAFWGLEVSEWPDLRKMMSPREWGKITIDPPERVYEPPAKKPKAKRKSKAKRKAKKRTKAKRKAKAGEKVPA